MNSLQLRSSPFDVNPTPPSKSDPSAIKVHPVVFVIATDLKPWPEQDSRTISMGGRELEPFVHELGEPGLSLADSRG